MLAQPAGQLQSSSLVTPLLHTLPSHSAALVVWSLSEQLVRTTLASPPLLCAALGSNLFPVRTRTSAIHGRLQQVRRAEKPRGSQKEAGSAALRHSDHCFFQSVRGALGSRRCPRWISGGAFASHRQSPVTASHQSRAPGHVSGPVAARSRPPRRLGRPRSFWVFPQRASKLQSPPTVLTISLFGGFV